MSTVALNAKIDGGSGDTTRTLRICKALVDDTDDMVIKALSWALRELVRSDAKAVGNFIDQREDELPARVLREVRNKIAHRLEKTGVAQK